MQQILAVTLTVEWRTSPKSPLFFVSGPSYTRTSLFWSFLRALTSVPLSVGLTLDLIWPRTLAYVDPEAEKLEMAEKLVTSSVKNFLVSLPSCFMELKANFQDIFCVDESSIQGLGSNTLLISERTAKTLNLSILDDCKTVWLVLELSLIYSDSDKINSSHGSKRLIQVLIDSTLSDDYTILSEDLVYNLEYSMGLRRSCHLISSVKPKELCISNVSNHSIAPFKAKKVIISPLQCEATLEDHFVDMILQSYFEIPRYLCKNDVFGVRIPSYIRFDSISNIKMDLIYFKVCDIEGNQYFNKKIHDTSYGYLVDSSASIYQVSNTQDLYPVKRFIAGNVLINELLNDAKLLKSIKSRGHNLIPECFEGTFQVLGNWTEPFLCGFKHLQDFKLNPIFLLSGPNGSGKTMLMEALGAYFGINYWRIDCVTLGEQIPGQVEAKLKMVFSKVNTISPCILHFSNIQALFEDEGGKVDVRVLASFEQQMRLFKPKLPVILMASTSNLKSFSSNVNQLFMDSTTLSSPNQTEREEILLWLVSCRRAKIDEEVIQTVGAQTSGFLLRDLEILVSLAFKEKINRTKGQITNERVNLVYSDFSNIIGVMRMMFSESIGAPKVPSVSWKDVGGLEHLKKEILRSLRSNLFSAGLKRSGLLLHGPPGTGKTLLAKAVATQCGRNFLSVKGPELLNMYVGQSEQNVRDLFELAKAASPCIIFFDELDSLAPNRGRSGDSGGVMDRVVSQLLAEMDSLNNCVDIFILGATNRPDLIDPALLRPGRLDKMLYVGPCEDKVSQLSVLTALTRKLKLSSDVDLAQLVSRLPSKVSGAQLSALCSAAWLSSARQTILDGGHLQNPEVLVSQKHFLAVIDSAV